MISEIYMDVDGYARYDEKIKTETVALLVAQETTGIKESDLINRCFSKSTSSEVAELEQLRQQLMRAIANVDVSRYAIFYGDALDLDEALEAEGISTPVEVVHFSSSKTYALGFDDEINSCLIIKKT